MARDAVPPILTAEPGLTHYLEEIRRFPILERQEEYLLAKRCMISRIDRAISPSALRQRTSVSGRMIVRTCRIGGNQR